MLVQEINKKSTLRWLLFVAVFCLGYLAGVFLNPLFWTLLGNHRQHDVDIEAVLTQPLVDFQTEVPITKDTLNAHKRNLLVFWSPTCKYCKQFFQYRLNSAEIGIFCFPLTDDFDYVKYYLHQSDIQYMQLCIADTNGIVSVYAPSVGAIPTFVVLDNEGNVIEQKRGITEIDVFIENLYK